MQDFQLIEYHHTRDFSRKMNATFEFIKQNWKSLGKASIVIAGPPVLIASLLMGSFYGEIFNIGNIGSNPDAALGIFTSAQFWVQLVLAMILFMLASVMSIATINNYILLYEELKTNDIPTSLVWERVRATFTMYLGTTFLFSVTIMAAGFVVAIVLGAMSAISSALLIFGIWAAVIGMFYVLFGASLTFIIRAYENTGFFPALMRSFNLVKGKWWSTFGLIMVLYFIMALISYIPVIPVYIVMGVTVFHNVSSDPNANPMEGMGSIMTILTTLYYTVQMILSAFPNIGIAFQYFNLVERKEARGLMASIDSFGEPAPPPSPTDETY